MKEIVDECRGNRPYYNPWEPELPGDVWTGWTEFDINDEANDRMEESPSSPAKRKAEGDHDEEDRQPTHMRTLPYDSDKEMADAGEIEAGLNMLGFDPDVTK